MSTNPYGANGPEHRPRWAPPITSPEEAREVIQTFWIPAIQTYQFFVPHRDPKQQEQGRENRRACLLALGEVALERGSIRPAVELRELARRTGLSVKVVNKHLKAEAEAKHFIKVLKPGRSNRAGGFATQYLLLVDRMRAHSGGTSRGHPRGYSRGDTTQALQAPYIHNNHDNQVKSPPPGAVLGHINNHEGYALEDDAGLQEGCALPYVPAQASPPQEGHPECMACAGHSPNGFGLLCDFHIEKEREKDGLETPLRGPDPLP